MKKHAKSGVLWCLLSLMLFINPAHAVFIDLSGISVDGAADTIIGPIAEDEDLGSGFQMQFWFTVEHFGTSWGTETWINVVNSFWVVDNILTGGDCGFTSNSGVFECDTFLTIAQDSLVGFGDTWTVTLRDTFNDGANPDYTFGQGSFIAWGDDLQAKVVPAPATLALFGLGLAGLGWSRRKKA